MSVQYKQLIHMEQACDKLLSLLDEKIKERVKKEEIKGFFTDLSYEELYDEELIHETAVFLNSILKIIQGGS